MEDYVTYQQAVKLKELGFDWNCDHYYQKENNPTIIDAIGDGSFKHISNFWQNFNIEDKSFNRHNQLLNPYCSAPTLAQAQKWLRELKKGIDVYVVTDKTNTQVNKREYNVKLFYVKDNTLIYDAVSVGNEFCVYPTYEEALSAGIDKALELIKVWKQEI